MQQHTHKHTNGYSGTYVSTYNTLHAFDSFSTSQATIYVCARHTGTHVIDRNERRKMCWAPNNIFDMISKALKKLLLLRRLLLSLLDVFRQKNSLIEYDLASLTLSSKFVDAMRVNEATSKGEKPLDAISIHRITYFIHLFILLHMNLLCVSARLTATTLLSVYYVVYIYRLPTAKRRLLLFAPYSGCRTMLSISCSSKRLIDKNVLIKMKQNVCSNWFFDIWFICLSLSRFRSHLDHKRCFISFYMQTRRQRRYSGREIGINICSMGSLGRYIKYDVPQQQHQYMNDWQVVKGIAAPLSVISTTSTQLQLHSNIIYVSNENQLLDKTYTQQPTQPKNSPTISVPNKNRKRNFMNRYNREMNNIFPISTVSLSLSLSLPTMYDLRWKWYATENNNGKMKENGKTKTHSAVRIINCERCFCAFHHQINSLPFYDVLWWGRREHVNGLSNIVAMQNNILRWRCHRQEMETNQFKNENALIWTFSFPLLSAISHHFYCSLLFLRILKMKNY